MEGHTPDFSLDVQGVTGFCPVGEAYAKQQLAAKKIPVLSCEGPCVRGEIARLAANLVAKEVPSLARACHGETFFVPHSAMASWVKSADKTIMIDGCFLKCHGRALKSLIGPRWTGEIRPTVDGSKPANGRDPRPVRFYPAAPSFCNV